MPAAAGGTGILLVAGCAAGSVVVVEPGHLRGAAGGDGVARIPAPAQDDRAEPYRIYAAGNAFDMRGTLSAHESLSAVCP